MKRTVITIGFSPHRIEALPFMCEQMEKHELIVLEDAPSSFFREMLRGDMSIDDYVMEQAAEFPKFEKHLCVFLRDLHRAGKRVVQVEPYLERLFRIHDLFEGKATVQNVTASPELREVYLAEKRATGALIDYYEKSAQASFDDVVEAVKIFARADANRFVLRDRLRAQAISSLTARGETIYVEAGHIHFPLYLHLRREIFDEEEIRVAFLLAPLIRKLDGKKRNLGPGDILTLLYAFRDEPEERRTSLLAARSLIYVKLISKEEIPPGISETPHLVGEVQVNHLVDELPYRHCRELFERIRSSTREAARTLVQYFVLNASS